MGTTSGFNISNFSKQNTLPLAQIIGDISLVLATISGIPLIISQCGVPVPPQLTVIATWAMVGGAVIKVVSKNFGITDTETGTALNPNPTSTPTQPVQTTQVTN